MFLPPNRVKDFLEPPPRQPTWADLLVECAVEFDCHFDSEQNGFVFELRGTIPEEFQEIDACDMVASLVGMVSFRYMPDVSPTLGPNLPRRRNGGDE